MSSKGRCTLGFEGAQASLQLVLAPLGTSHYRAPTLASPGACRIAGGPRPRSSSLPPKPKLRMAHFLPTTNDPCFALICVVDAHPATLHYSRQDVPSRDGCQSSLTGYVDTQGWPHRSHLHAIVAGKDALQTQGAPRQTDHTLPVCQLSTFTSVLAAGAQIFRRVQLDVLHRWLVFLAAPYPSSLVAIIS